MMPGVRVRRRRAAVLAAGVLILGIGSEAALAQYHYVYRGQPVPLALRADLLASFAADGDEAATVLRNFGAAPAEADWAGPRGWSMFTALSSKARPEDVEALVAAAADMPAVEFASPVFIDRLGGPLVVTPDILVAFDPTVPPDERRRLLDRVVGGHLLDENWARMEGVYRVRSLSRNGFDVLREANALSIEPGVRFAEPDMIFSGRASLICTPNDSLYPSLWGLNQASDVDMDAPEAWQITRGSAAIRVVVIDVGVQQDHPDMNQAPGADFTGSGGGGGPVNQCDNHGTAVAGCVSATIDNALGVVGLAPLCLSASARCFNSNLSCNGSWSGQASWTVAALDWAQSSGARVTNNSNYYGFTSSAIEQKYNDTRNAGIVHFASAGNDSSATIGYPASLPTVNAIAALSQSGARASFSNWGTGLDFSAPGVGIWSTDRTGSDGYTASDYASVQGTSFASPYSAAVAALLLSYNPGLSAPQVESTMAAGCTDLGTAGYDTDFGWGMVNAYATLLQFASPPAPPGPFSLMLPEEAAVAVADRPVFMWSASAGAVEYSLTVDDNANFGSVDYSAAGIAGTSHQPPQALEQNRTYYWRVTAVNCIGQAGATPASGSFSTWLDCNDNDVPDAVDISGGFSQDCNKNGQPDECDLVAAFRASSADMTPINRNVSQTFSYAARPAVASVSLAFSAFADLNFASESFDVRINGVSVGTAFGPAGQDCPLTPSQETLMVPAATYNALITTGGPTDLTVVASTGVDETCAPASWVSVIITYVGVATSADENSNQTPDECENPFALGDMNCDGNIDVLDINPFILALSDPIAYAAQYPTCDINNGDINNDGNVDVLDINPFVALLVG
ncbi:Thermophilic serine proteinase precursor [Phycisphaerae bacterium RAS1]|nr:Thermophilic serine proteinase precursor [Phycisphaerae bacterium RAS1]